MLRLHELQKAFSAALFSVDDVASINTNIDAGQLLPTEALAIYRNNLHLSMAAALGDHYPVIKQLLGNDYFDCLATQYLHKHPSRCGSLHEYGAYFPDFLLAEQNSHQLVYLADVARVEWACQLAFHAADAEPFSLQALGQWSEDDVVQLLVRLHPSAILFSSEYAVASIWQAHQAEDGVIAELCYANPEQGLVFRHGLSVMVRSLRCADFAFIQALYAGQSLEAAADAALLIDDDYDLMAAIRQLFSDGVIIDMYIPEAIFL